MTLVRRILSSLNRSAATIVLLCSWPAFSFAATQAVWTVLPSAGALQSPATGFHALDWTPSVLSSLAIGETAVLTLPGGGGYEVTTVRIEAHPNGDRSWVGKFEANGKTYTTVLTFGEAGIVGSVRTPEGLFQVQMENGVATLIDVRDGGGIEVPLVADARFGSSPVTPLTPETTGAEPAQGLKDLNVGNTTIDVLIGYTDGFVTARTNQAGALLRINNLIALTNQAYIDSQIAITLRLVNAVQVTYPDNTQLDVALEDLRTGAGAVPSSLRGTLRDRYGADMVVLLRQYTLNMGGCGLADVGGFGNNGANIAAYANSYAVVFDGRVDLGGGAFSFCAEGTLAHELGHNMGALHDAATTAAEGGGVGAYSYAYGYVTADAVFGGGVNQCPNNSQSCFGTIMAYVRQFIPETLKFSSPNVATCGTGVACGTANANVALALNNTRDGVAGWRGTRLPFQSNTQTGSGQTTVAGTPFALPLKVIVKDQLNNLVQGVTVTFAAPGAGASANLSATSVTSDAQGVAQVTATANATNGNYQVTATANPGFVTTTYAFNLTNGSVTPVLTVAKAGSGSGTVTGSGISLINCGATCASPPMPIGTSITLTGTPAGGSTLTGWLGAPGCPGNAPCTVVVNNNTTVTATFAPSNTLVPPGVFPSKVDPDLNGSSQALADGLIVLRHLFGLTGAPLTANALGANPTRTDPTQVTTFLNDILPQLDIDGDGRADALTDGVLYLRYLFGLRGTNLITGVVAAGASRTSSAAIETYIASIVN